MNKFQIITVLTIFIRSDLFSQIDSLKNEILNYQETKTLLIAKGRKMINDKFIKCDFTKVREVEEYLTKEIEDEKYFAFYTGEKWLLFYWTTKYNELLNQILQYDSLLHFQTFQKIKPLYDSLYYNLQLQSRIQRNKIKANIDSSEFTKIEKEILKLNFDYLIAEEDLGCGTCNAIYGFSKYQEVTQDSLNLYATQYLSAYPNLKYEDYIRKHIREIYKASIVSCGWDMFLGYGTFTKKLHQKFSDVAAIGFTFNGFYNDVALFLRGYIGSGNTNDSIPLPTVTWQKDISMNIYLYEASVGYLVYSNRLFNSTPFIGIATTSITPTDYYKEKMPQYEHIRLNYTTTYTLGMNIDFNLFPKSKRNVWRPEDATMCLRLRYAYNLSQFEQKYQGLTGGIHYLTIGIAMTYRNIKRDF